VKNKAELVVLAANARIGDEIRAIPKANKHQFTAAGKLTNGRKATGLPGTSRSRLQKIAAIPKAELIKAGGPINQDEPAYESRIFCVSPATSI
jgi:hypothetical protein